LSIGDAVAKQVHHRQCETGPQQHLVKTTSFHGSVPSFLFGSAKAFWPFGKPYQKAKKSNKPGVGFEAMSVGFAADRNPIVATGAARMSR
jgi:ABC-type uncharacterized transport system permease subunit